MESDGHVTCVEHDGRSIYIVGTAHVSQKSVEEVAQVIEELRPDTVCVELDQSRYEALIDDSRWKRLDLFQIIRQKKVLYLLSNLALSAYQKRIGDRMGVRPGAELLAAVEKAKAVGAKLILVDRDIQATLKRTWHRLGFWNKARLTSGMLVAPFSMQEMSEEQIENLKDRDAISELMDELALVMPDLKEPLIDERDQYLVASVREAPGTRIVAVVGAGHVRGMVNFLRTPVDRAALSTIPPPSRWVTALGWLIPLVVLGAFAVGWREHQGESLVQMLRAWVLPTSIGCGLFTLLALGHPLTILSGILAAPLTTLNPTIGAGMVTALVEAWLRRPTVEDCQGVPQAIMHPGSWYRNRATRVLLVFILSSIGASIGMAVGTTWVLSLLG